MAYLVNGGVFAVPNSIVDQYMHLCDEKKLKALLLILRHGGDVSPEEIARQFALSLPDALDIASFWLNRGILREETAPAVSPTAHVPPAPAAVEEPAPPRPSPAEEVAFLPQKKRPDASPSPETEASAARPPRHRFTTAQINEMSRGDENIALLLQEAQGVLGRTLTPVSSETLTALYSYHGMAPDIILMLLQYCVFLKKNSMSYVEKVAAEWIEKGIDTHEKAEAEIKRAMLRGTTEGRLRGVFCVGDRTFIPSEREHIRRWTEDLGYSVELISLAYERTIEQKGKLSFAYLGGILEKWHEKGVKTVQQAHDEMLGGKKAQRPAVAGRAESAGVRAHEVAELEALTRVGIRR